MNLVPDSLAARLTLWNTAVILGFFAVAFPLLYVYVELALRGEMDGDLIEDIDHYRQLMRDQGEAAVRAEMARELASDQPGKVFFRLLAADGSERFAGGVDARATVPPRLAVSVERVANDSPLLTTVEREGAAEETRAFRVVTDQIGPALFAQIGESMQEIEALKDLLLDAFGLLYLTSVPLSALLGWLLARHGLRDIHKVRRAAEDIAGGNLERRVEVGNPGSEIRRLAASFNGMVDRVQALIAGMREMTDNIAHDMKGPLARIRTHCELALANGRGLDDFRSAAADTIEETERLHQMLDATLALAEAEARVGGEGREPIPLLAVAAEACELFEPLADAKGIDLRLAPSPAVQIAGRLPEIQRLLANLIDNAIKYTPAPGTVEVWVDARTGVAELGVRDTGPGIPRQDRERIFQRFYRGEKSRSSPGFGLGLSFCRAVARGHGGELSVDAHAGGGSVFTLTLPVLA
jgi:signal transduction histidine kinase